ncbi:MAG TPA: adenylyltransferase/cytidyltransferase family protein [Candidatus Methylomirabilis sp.]|nr:adenylyltransferase/cytidyltransferase family protein [Candidatus Methylomirabilis sp.]
MTTALVIGTFDGLHKGHEDYFRQAKAYGDRVVAVVARDRTVLDVKGQLPRMNEELRRAAVDAHPFVDFAVLGYEDDKLRAVCEQKPDVVVLGYDQQSFTDSLEERLCDRGLRCRVVRAEPFEPGVYKSSLLRGSLSAGPDRPHAEMEPVKDWLPL